MLTDQERGDLPGRQLDRQPLHEVLELGDRVAARRTCHRTKAVDDDERRPHPLHLSLDGGKQIIEIAGNHSLAQVDEVDVLANPLDVEERELLLVSQQLQRRLAEHRDVERRSLGRRVREDELLHQRRLARPRTAGDHAERVLRQSAPEHLVEARHAGLQATDRNT